MLSRQKTNPNNIFFGHVIQGYILEFVLQFCVPEYFIQCHILFYTEACTQLLCSGTCVFQCYIWGHVLFYTEACTQVLCSGACVLQCYIWGHVLFYTWACTCAMYRSICSGVIFEVFIMVKCYLSIVPQCYILGYALVLHVCIRACVLLSYLVSIYSNVMHRNLYSCVIFRVL